MLLLLDNYDSFTWNLVDLFEELAAKVVVAQNDELDADGALALSHEFLVVSPGPGRPAESGARRSAPHGRALCANFLRPKPS